MALSSMVKLMKKRYIHRWQQDMYNLSHAAIKISEKYPEVKQQKGGAVWFVSSLDGYVHTC